LAAPKRGAGKAGHARQMKGRVVGFHAWVRLTPEAETMNSQDNERDVWIDAVSHEAVAEGNHHYQSFYEGKHYHFADRVNKQTFDEDPQLWVSTAHASQTSAHLSAAGEDE